MKKLEKVLKKTKDATPISRVLKYIMRCVMGETESYQKKFPLTTSNIDIKVFQAWEEQKLIRWKYIQG